MEEASGGLGGGLDRRGFNHYRCRPGTRKRLAEPLAQPLETTVALTHQSRPSLPRAHDVPRGSKPQWTADADPQSLRAASLRLTAT
jgi:hypothetical protein